MPRSYDAVHCSSPKRKLAYSFPLVQQGNQNPSLQNITPAISDVAASHEYDYSSGALGPWTKAATNLGRPTVSQRSGSGLLVLLVRS